MVEPFGLFKRRTKRLFRRGRKALVLAGAAIALGFSTGGARGGFSAVARAAAAARSSVVVSSSPAPAPVQAAVSVSVSGPALVLERPMAMAAATGAVRPGAVAGVLDRGGKAGASASAAASEKTVRELVGVRVCYFMLARMHSLL